MYREHAPIDAAIAAALAAGEAIMRHYAGGVSVWLKSDRSPVTVADEEAHRIITSTLAATGLPLLSEEGVHAPAAERQAWERYWLVDPLDGTRDFVAGTDDFTVNIALMQRDAAFLPAALGVALPVAGVLYVPAKDRLYFAWSGGGAYRLDHARTFGAVGAYELAAHAVRLPMYPPPNVHTVVASRMHASPDTQAFVARREAEHGSVRVHNVGSALKIGLVAEGSAHVYPRYAPTMEWDTAAGQIIAQEAGKALLDTGTGEPMRYNKKELVNPWFIVE